MRKIRLIDCLLFKTTTLAGIAKFILNVETSRMLRIAMILILIIKRTSVFFIASAFILSL